MKLLVKKENQIFGKGVLHIEGCGEVIVKCVSAQRFSSTMIRWFLYKTSCFNSTEVKLYHKFNTSVICRMIFTKAPKLEYVMYTQKLP